MAEKEVKKKQETENTVLLTIEELAKNKKIRDSILNGVMAYKGWARGKKITESEFDKAVTAYLKIEIK